MAIPFWLCGPKYHSVISCNRKGDIMSIKRHGSILQKRWFQFSNLINNSLQGYDLIGIHFEDGSRCDCTSFNEGRPHSLHSIEKMYTIHKKSFMNNKSKDCDYVKFFIYWCCGSLRKRAYRGWYHLFWSKVVSSRSYWNFLEWLWDDFLHVLNYF